MMVFFPNLAYCAMRAILVLPPDGAVPGMRTRQSAEGLPAYQKLVARQHAGIPGVEFMQLFGQDLSLRLRESATTLPHRMR